MVEDRIGYKYAKSLFEIAQEEGLVDSVKKDMDMIIELIDTNIEFKRFLHSPIIPNTQKQDLLNKIFSGRLSTSESMDMISMLSAKGREMYLKELALAFQGLYDKSKNILRGTVISPEPLSDDFLKDIIAKVEKNRQIKLELLQETDPDLIGGFILKLGDRVFDGSVRRSLRRIERKLVTEA